MNPEDLPRPETARAESIGHMLTRLRLIVEDGGDSESVRHEIVARFEKLEQERDAAVASVAREAAGRREEAQRAADLADEIGCVREERDAVVDALAAARAQTERLIEQIRQMKTDPDSLQKQGRSDHDFAAAYRSLILAAMRGER